MCDEVIKTRSKHAWEVEYDHERGEVVTRATWDLLTHLDFMLGRGAAGFWGGDDDAPDAATDAVRDWVYAMIEIVP